MKKSLLLLVAGAISLSVGAQERQVNIFRHHQDNGKKIDATELVNSVNQRHNSRAAQRTTTTLDRWYFYGDYLTGIQNYATVVQGTGIYPEFMSPWADTLGRVFFTDGTNYVTMVSMGTILNPSDSAFNDEHFFTGLMKIKSTNAYTVDSVELLGSYGINAADSNVVDTIRLTFVAGPLSGSGPFVGGTLGGGGYYGAASFPSLPYDSVTNISDNYAPATNQQDIILNNHAGAAPGSTAYTATSGGVWSKVGGTLTNYDGVPVGSPAWGDTDANGNFIVLVPLATTLSGSAGSGVGVSESFFSGRPHPGPIPGDTLADFNTHATGGFTGDYKYSCYRPYSFYAAASNDASAAPAFPPYGGGATAGASGYPYLPYTTSSYNLNTGLFKELPNYQNGWENTYLPTWAWSAGAGAAEVQYPYINLHLTCATCGVVDTVIVSGVNNVINTVNTVNAYPNPANASFNIAFNLAQAAPVTVTLTNMVGEVVATQNMGNTAKGKAFFSTANLPEGIYIYTLTANGVNSTGHVSVVH